MTPRIVITMGEPAGVGPDIVAQLANHSWPAQLIVVGDPALLQARAAPFSPSLSLIDIDLSQAPTPHQAGTLSVLPIALNKDCKAGQLEAANAAYVIECLRVATDACLDQKAHALVTGPVQKSILNSAGFAFRGHTEFLAERCHATDVIMLFVVKQLKVALLTTHLPLKDVASAVTIDNILRVVRLLSRELQHRFGIKDPTILVSGLNPHAGEHGHLGREEIDIIEPALAILRQENIHVVGPLPADTIFTEKHLKTADAILAMYHDQALPVVKYIGFDHAVNVTLGLPIIRTSVDHGTALDIAGTSLANPGSMIEAVRLAIRFAQENRQSLSSMV